MLVTTIQFPRYSGLRCLMMPYIQGDPDSVPTKYQAYRSILETLHFVPGEIGYLTIDESPVTAGKPHRGKRAKHGRAIHTEAGRLPGQVYNWGGGGGGTWGGKPNVILDRDTQILLANNTVGSCAVWDTEHEDTSEDGDLGHVQHLYPYGDACYLLPGEVYQIGILTPHESLPVPHSTDRQFLRIISNGVHGREPYFTINTLLSC